MPCNAIKLPGIMKASNGSDSNTYLGEPAVPSGFLGRGKSMPSCTTVGPEVVD